MPDDVGNIRFGIRHGIQSCLIKWNGFAEDNCKGAWKGLLFLLVVVVAAWLGVNMHVLGYRFWEAPEIEQDYAMGVIWWCIFAIGILAFSRDNCRMLLLAWAGKFFVVLGAMLFYEYFYGLDAGGYFWAAKTGYHGYFPGIDMRNHLNPFILPAGADVEVMRTQWGTVIFLRILWIVTAITGPFYHAVKVAFAFMGFLGVWFFYRAIVVALGRPNPAAFYVLAFFPSIIFWSSILGKDPFLLLTLGLYAYGVSGWLVHDRLLSLCFIGAGLFGVYQVRAWMGMIAASAFVLAVLLGRSQKWQRSLVLIAVLVLIPLIGEQQIAKTFRLSSEGAKEFLSDPTKLTMLFDVADLAAKGMSMESKGSGGSGVDLEGLAMDGGIGGNLLVGIFSGFFRPLPFDITNPFTALAAVENTVVFVLAIIALCRVRLAYLRDPLVIWLAAFCLMWATVYGFIVMANFGSGVRYKLQMWPFFLMLLLLLVHREGRALLDARIPRN